MMGISSYIINKEVVLKWYFFPWVVEFAYIENVYSPSHYS